eukprot:s31_g5.t1
MACWICFGLFGILAFGLWTLRSSAAVPFFGRLESPPVLGRRRSRRVVGLSPSVVSFLWTWILVCANCRIGEARKPGPDWTMAVANLNGLNNRAFGLASGDFDTWLFSETHLTKVGAKVFWSNLRSAGSPYRAFVTGCTVAPRSESSEVGQWSGVAVLSTFPVRRLPHAWPTVAYNSGRLVCTSVCAHGLWISGVTVYGTPTGPTHVNGRYVTNELLAQALDRVEQLPGPRFIAGDFNHDWDRLDTIHTMHRLGYQDIQDLHAASTGVLPRATCRGKTRRDFLFVSREFAALFITCTIHDDTVADHSYVVGHFRGGPASLVRFSWTLPDPMDWEPSDKRAPVDPAVMSACADATVGYTQFWHSVEQNNMRARAELGKPCVRAMLGRATQSQPVMREGRMAPLKTSRPGDRQPAFLGSCLQHAKWTKQLRRLQSYVRLVASGVPSAVHRSHQLQLWSAIRSAHGFPPDFVVAIDEDECAVDLAPPVKWLPDVPILHGSAPLAVIHVADDKLWLESCHGLAIGDQLSQRRQLGCLPELFQAFETQWSSLWNRHQHVPASQWTQILDFARQHLRPVSSPAPALDVGLLRRTLQRKSKHAATGLDGVSRADLLALSDTDFAVLSQVYHTAHATGTWPCQTLQGYVRSLAKVDTPMEVGHFRPITVFSNVYRLWSSVVARHWLRAVSSSVDAFLCGNTVGGRAAMVWRYVLEQVENAHREGGEVCGFSADIVKAFNVLPRLPALAAVKMMGVDHATLTAWAGALNGFKRHFVIQGSYFCGVTSVNGFPEGCALSCLAMMALTEIFHRWIQASHVSFRPLSYVDNWGVILQSVDYMQQAVDSIESFVRALGIELDSSKSYCWAANPSGRRALRAAGFTVLLRSRELGAHVVYTRQLSNFHTLERFRALDDFWSKLASCPCTFRQKVQLIQRVAWPRAFHAVSAVVVGRKHFEALRTSVMQALKLQKPGANPELQCALEGCAFDPLLCAALDTLRDARSLSATAQVTLDFDLGVFDAAGGEYNTLSEILCQRLHQVGFTVEHGAMAIDSFGSFNFLACPLDEFVFRLQWIWPSVLASAVRHRRTLVGFQHVDLSATRRAYLQLDPYDQGIMRKYLHGASFTNEHACHWSHDGNPNCIHCGSPDSVQHRLWFCPASQQLRDQLPMDFVLHKDSLPLLLLEHGWTLRSPLATSWFQYLAALPVSVGFHPVPCPGGILDLFTDGSCLYPTQPDLRVAAFSVIASVFTLDPGPASFRPVVAQPLPGLLQTPFRAELSAVLAALRLAISRGICVRIWTDCLNVIKAYRKYCLDQVRVNPNGRNSDLLSQFCDLVHQLGTARVAVLKVPAHEDPNAYSTDLEKWLVAGNAAADKAAEVANTNRPEAVWSLWNAYVTQVFEHRTHAQVVRSHMIAVSKLWSAVPQTKSQPEIPKPPRAVRPGRAQPVLAWSSPHGFQLRKPAFRRFFGLDLASDVHSWLERIRDEEQPLRWISYIHLYISFQRHVGPWSIGKPNGKWLAEKGELARLANHSRLAVRVKHFRLMVQQFLRDAEVHHVTASVRPHSQWIACFRGSIGFQLSNTEFEAIEEFLAANLTTPATGSGRALDLLRGV